MKESLLEVPARFQLSTQLSVTEQALVRRNVWVLLLWVYYVVWEQSPEKFPQHPSTETQQILRHFAAS